jgi:hypothetical protein
MWLNITGEHFILLDGEDNSSPTCAILEQCSEIMRSMLKFVGPG